MFVFVLENGHECSIKIKDDNRRIICLLIQLSDRLLQQDVMEVDEVVFSSIALSEGGAEGAARKTP